MTRARMILPSLALLGCLAASQDLSAGWGCIMSTGRCVTGGLNGHQWCSDSFGFTSSGSPSFNFTHTFSGFCYFA
jgi:hypothetical protein